MSVVDVLGQIRIRDHVGGGLHQKADCYSQQTGQPSASFLKPPTSHLHWHCRPDPSPKQPGYSPLLYGDRTSTGPASGHLRACQWHWHASALAHRSGPSLATGEERGGGWAGTAGRARSRSGHWPSSDGRTTTATTTITASGDITAPRRGSCNSGRGEAFPTLLVF